jgi:predicted SprT family Zn-dependent metalloprotease
MYTEEILKKLTKKDLIHIILNKDNSVAPQDEVISKKDEMAQKLKVLRDRRRAERVKDKKVKYEYTCFHCGAIFTDISSHFIKDINDPKCERCRKKNGNII